MSAAILAGMLAGAAAADPVSCTTDGPDFAAVVGAFRTALIDRSPDDLLAVLARDHPLRLTTTIDQPWQTELVPRASLEADFRAGGGLFQLLLDGGPDDDLADLVAALPPRWIVLDLARFGPRGGDGRVFVQLGCEGGVPRVGEIGWPAS